MLSRRKIAYVGQAKHYTANFKKILRNLDKAAIFCHMHFSRHISLSHSISSLLAALKLRVAR